MPDVAQFAFCIGIFVAIRFKFAVITGVAGSRTPFGLKCSNAVVDIPDERHFVFVVEVIVATTIIGVA